MTKKMTQSEQQDYFNAAKRLIIENGWTAQKAINWLERHGVDTTQAAKYLNRG